MKLEFDNTSKKDTLRAAKLLCAELGNGWKPRVEEEPHAEWQYYPAAVLGQMMVVFDRGKFFCDLSAGKGLLQDSTSWYDRKLFRSPAEAVRHKLQLAEAFVEKTTEHVNKNLLLFNNSQIEKQDS